MEKHYCVKAEHIFKRFSVLQQERTLLRTLRSFMGGTALSKQFFALSDVTFCLNYGERTALVGRNGSGKTTLLRIISGIYEQTSGMLECASVPNALFRFGVGFNSELPVVDNIFLTGALSGLDRRILVNRIHAILKMAGLEHMKYALLKHLSSGQIQRLAATVFFENESDFLIFDESLAFVDGGFAQNYRNFLKRCAESGRTLLISSHDTDFLRECCTKALWLEEGKVVNYGDADKVLREYAKFICSPMGNGF